MQDILISNLYIRQQYSRWCIHFEAETTNVPNQVIGVMDVLRAHFLIADYFYDQNEGIGGVGPRDFGLLESAVCRQFVSFGGVIKWITQYEQCATFADRQGRLKAEAVSPR